jgi:hypothetical protein
MANRTNGKSRDHYYKSSAAQAYTIQLISHFTSNTPASLCWMQQVFGDRSLLGVTVYLTAVLPVVGIWARLFTDLVLLE